MNIDRWKRRTHTLVAVGLFCGAIRLPCQAERTLVQDIVIAAPVGEVWKAFTDEVKARDWIAPKTKFDIRVGGEMRSSHDANSTLDDDKTIVNRILSLEPERLLSIQNVKAPAGFKNAELFQKTWTVIHFESLGANSTRLRSVGLGYGDGPDWDVVYDFFTKGNSYLYGELKKRLESGPASDPDKVLEILDRMAGGDWIHESPRPDGKTFRSRSHLQKGPDGKSLVGQGWLTGPAGMFYHAATLIYREPTTGLIRFINVDEGGSTSQGEIRSIAADTLSWDWRLTTSAGELREFIVETKFTGVDEYVFKLETAAPDGTRQVMVEVPYKRVSDLPAEFTVP